MPDLLAEKLAKRCSELDDRRPPTCPPVPVCQVQSACACGEGLSMGLLVLTGFARAQPIVRARSTRCAREGAGSNGSAKYCVSWATSPSRNSIMLTAYDGTPS